MVINLTTTELMFGFNKVCTFKPKATTFFFCPKVNKYIGNIDDLIILIITNRILLVLTLTKGFIQKLLYTGKLDILLGNPCPHGYPSFGDTAIPEWHLKPRKLGELTPYQ